MKKTIMILLLLTKNKDYTSIKNILDTCKETEKGKLFELYLVELFKGNGYIAKREGGKDDNGGDVLVYHPLDAEHVFMIIQAKNQKRPLVFNYARSELVKFEKDGQKIYNCNSYTLISINGFVTACSKFKKTNMKLESWDYVKSLIDTYDENNKLKNPKIQLLAHNKIAYEEVKEIWLTSNKAAVIQATGTGKSYIILQLILDYYESMKIIVAPSKYIFTQLKEKVSWVSHNTKFITYQKLSRMSKEEILLLVPSLIIFDEMHRIGAKTWEKGYEKILKAFPDAKFVGLTATPIRYLDNSRDISKDIFDNNTTTELTLTRAIAEKILPMITYITSLYTLGEEISDKIKQINESRCKDSLKSNLIDELHQININWEKTQGVSTILKKYIINKKDSMKFIVFCSDMKHLKKMSLEVERWFVKAFPSKIIKKYIVISGINGEKQELKDFISNNNKNTINLLLCVDKLNEGLHIKGVTGVILLRKTQSLTIFYQQIGRAISINNEKPLIFDLVNNFGNLKNKDFINDLYKSIEDEKKYRKEIGIEYIVPEIKIFEEIKQTEKLFEEIEQKLINLWNYRYNELVEYKNIHSDCLIPQHYKKNRSLGSWVTTQREKYKKKLLVQDKIDKLNKIGFTWEPIEEQWDQMYNQLVEYFNIHGGCLVPNHYKENISLGKWVAKQRDNYKSNRLFVDKINKLNEIEFSWNPLEEKREKMYNDLVEYKNIHGNCTVPQHYQENISLGYWVSTQREKFKKNLLSPDEINKFNEIGFVWNSSEEQWDYRYNQLVEYFKTKGNCLVPATYNNNKSLGLWVSEQRKNYNKNKLCECKINKLNEIEFSWNPLEEQWNQMCNQIIKYKNLHGDCLISKKDIENKQLVNWVNNQRYKYNKSGLLQEKIQMLNEIGFIWSCKHKGK